MPINAAHMQGCYVHRLQDRQRAVCDKAGVRDNAAEIIIFQLRLLVNLISFS